MHRLLHSVVLLALTGLLVGCPGDDGLTELDVDMRVSPTTLEFGPVYADQTRTLPVMVENTGAAPLVFSNLQVDSENGPATVRLDPTRPRLEAGESMAIEVRVTASPMSSGIFTARFDVDADRGPSVEVNLSAEIRPLPPCDDDNPCTVDTFDGSACVNEPAINGSPCDDDNACTLATVCVEAQCVGQAITCADSVECTVDYCDPDVGCVFEPMNATCDDGDSCTVDTCNGVVGCINEPAPVGAVCHLDECNEIGFCIAGSCALQPVPDGVPCEDGDLCTENDTCQSQTCTPGVQRDTGAADPIVVVANDITADLCLHQETETNCALGFTAFADVRPARVLATHTGSDGRSLVLWQSNFARDGGFDCSPYPTNGPPAPALNPVHPVPPDDEAGRRAPPAEDEAAEPPFSNICAAGIFYTQTDPLSGASATVQLTTTALSAAGAFALDESGLLAVATVEEATGNIHVRQMPVTESAFAGLPHVFSPLPERRRTTGPAPLSALAVNIGSSGIVLAATPQWRNLYASPDACGDQCVCQDIDGDTFCEGGLPAAYVAATPLGVGLGLTQTTLSLVEAPPLDIEECGDNMARPMRPDGLSVRADDSDVAVIALRLTGRACDDHADPPLLDQRQVYIGTAASTDPLAPLPHDPPPLRLQQLDLRFAPAMTGVVVTDNPECLTNEDPDCADWLTVVNAQIGDTGIAVEDTLLDSLPLDSSTSAQLIGLDDGIFSLLRAGQSFQVIRRDVDTGLIERVAAPPLSPADTVFGDMVTGPGQAAFTTLSEDPDCAGNAIAPDAGPPTDGGGGAAPPVCDAKPQIMVQRFGCYYGQTSTGCLAHDDCDDASVCTTAQSVCLPPPECEGDDCDTCAGRCVAPAEQCIVLDVCPGYGETLAPECPGTTRAHFGGDSTCTWQCVDENCAPLLFQPGDAGPGDAGEADGGDTFDGGVDAGLSDAASVDASLLDGGAINTDGADAGLSDAG